MNLARLIDSRTAGLELSQDSRDEMLGFETKRLAQAITMGIGTIMWARNCLLLAIGEAKATAVSAALDHAASPTCPASAL